MCGKMRKTDHNPSLSPKVENSNWVHTNGPLGNIVSSYQWVCLFYGESNGFLSFISVYEMKSETQLRKNGVLCFLMYFLLYQKRKNGVLLNAYTLFFNYIHL